MRLLNKHGSVSVQQLGAMLHDCVFRLDNGREVRPLYDAPWRGDSGPEFDAQPPVIKALGGEWPCVPFGRPAGDLSLPSEWNASDEKPWDDWAHGFSSNNDWQLERLGEEELRATIHYPEQTPIQQLERKVRLLSDAPGVAFSLTIHARRKTSFPLGLHPVLSMQGAAAGTLRLNVAEEARVWSMPVDVEPGRSYFVPDQHNCQLNRLASYVGGESDVRALPPEGQTEDLLLLSGTNGTVGLSNPVLGCTTTILWNVTQLPACLLWVSNGGRNYYPWNGRVAALGIEPAASAFDLGMTHSLSENTPLAQHGVRTAVSVAPDAPFVCDYRILITPV